jgi:large subunit ribosomal protein L29
MTDIADFRGKTPDELKDKTLELKKELFNLRFQVATGELSNNSRFRAVRRDIARIQTVMNEPADAVKPVKKEKAAKPAKEVKAAEAKAPKESKAKKPATKKKASGE